MVIDGADLGAFASQLGLPCRTEGCLSMPTAVPKACPMSIGADVRFVVAPLLFAPVTSG
jgi:hypothetical protein